MGKGKAWHLLLFSGSDRKKCLSVLNYAKALFNDETHTEEDICRIVNDSEKSGNVRGFLSFTDKNDFFEQTSRENLRFISVNENVKLGKKTVMLFPGHGVYQKDMMRLLSEVHPFFEKRLKELAETASSYYDIGLFEEDKTDDVIKHIRMFAAELVMAQFWEYSGCNADILIGHSFGEYAAACFAGVMSEADAIRMIVIRNKLNVQGTGYQMAALETDMVHIEDMAEKAGAKIYISAYNCKGTITITADISSMQKMEEKCRNEKVNFNLINKHGGGHFIGLKAQADDFMRKISDIRFSKPCKTLISTVYPEKDDNFISAEYWRDHICDPVLFAKSCEMLDIAEIGRLIDVGVSPVLLGMAMKNIGNVDVSWIPSVRAGRNYRSQIYNALGAAYCSGADIKYSKEL